MNAKADVLWALDVLNRHAPEPLTYEGRPLENVGGVVLATAETANAIRHYVGDPAVDQFKRLCERDEPYRGRRGVAGDGDEWLRRVRLENAGQLDAFEE